MEKAKRSDRKTEQMPEDSQSLMIERDFTAEEFNKITDGIIPRDMDDRWFVYYEAPFLFLHRSWTGFCIFLVKFEPISDQMRIVEVIVNCNKNQYTQSDVSKNIILLNRLLDGMIESYSWRKERDIENKKRHARMIVSVAEKMLSAQISVIEGWRQLVSLVAQTKLYDSDSFLIFRSIASEAEVLPNEKSRQFWNSDVLKSKDKNSADYEASVKDNALMACRKLIGIYKTLD